MCSPAGPGPEPGQSPAMLGVPAHCANALGMSIPKLIAGTVVIENIFAWPGMGNGLCVTAIFNRDFLVIQAYVLIMAVFLSSAILLWI